VLTGVFLALYFPFIFYAASGMEAVAFTSLVTLAFVGPVQWQPIVAPLLVVMRPEGALVAASTSSHLRGGASAGDWSSRRRLPPG
jgi:hypothetical protein